MEKVSSKSHISSKALHILPFLFSTPKNNLVLFDILNQKITNCFLDFSQVIPKEKVCYYETQNTFLILVDNFLYLIGGSINWKVINSTFRIELINSVTNKIINPLIIQKMSNLIIPRCHLAAVQISNKFIYAIGGHDSLEPSKYTKDCEVYNIAENKWNSIKPLNTINCQPSSCTFKNQIIFTFGINFQDKQKHETIEKYDTNFPEKGWETVGVQMKYDFMTLRERYPLACCQISDSSLILCGCNKSIILQCDWDKRFHKSYDNFIDAPSVLCISQALITAENQKVYWGTYQMNLNIHSFDLNTKKTEKLTFVIDYK